MTKDKKALAIRLLEIMQIQPTLETMAMAEEGIDLIVGECVAVVNAVSEGVICPSCNRYQAKVLKALQTIIKPTCRICQSTDIEDKGMCHECLVETYK